MKIIYSIKYFSFIFLFLIIFSKSASSQTATLQATFSLQNEGGISVPFQNGIPVPTFEKQDRQIIDLDGTWKKFRFNADHNISLAARDSAGYANLLTEAQNMFSPSFNDSGWVTKIIPSVENAMYPYPQVPEYYENGVWYRKSFNVSDSLNGKFFKLMFLAVNYTADVWLNGHYLGYHEGGYTSFAFDVSKYLNFGGSNLLAVRIDNPPWGKRNDIVPYTQCDWFNYAGIVHDVYIEVSNPVSVIRTDIVPLDTAGNLQTTVVMLNKSGLSTQASVQVDVYNTKIDSTNILSEKASALISTLAQVSGNTTNTILIDNDSIAVWRTQIQVNNPKLWSPANPNLYVMKVTLKDSGKVVDEYYTQFGIRKITTDSAKVLLNGHVVFFTGVARHEDHPVYGRSIPDSVIYSDLLKIKALNANMIRTAHYPNTPFTYLLADRMGFAILEEIPVWQFDDPNAFIIQNTSRHIHQQMFREMVFRDYNRPSIFLWSTCNECLDLTNRTTYIQTIRDDYKNNYDDGRLLTESAAADRPGPEDQSVEYCDVAGWTMYFGVFYGSDYYSGTKTFLQTANTDHPTKPILDTEFGYWSTENNSTQNAQALTFYSTFKAFAELGALKSDGSINPNGGYLMGTTWWCAFDWYSAGHPSGFESMGIYSMDRTTPKFVAKYLVPQYQPYFNYGGMQITALKNESLENLIPGSYELSQNYPNPFNPSTTIHYEIPNPGIVTLKIYDVLGRVVETLVNQYQVKGKYDINFNASVLSSGIYFYQLSAGNFNSTRKMILLK